MNDLRPYDRVEAPLSAGARFIRGFKRVGAVLGCVVLLTGLGISAFIGITERNSRHNRYAQAVCIGNLKWSKTAAAPYEYDKSKIDLGKSGCYGPMYAETSPAIAEVANNPPGALEGFFEPAFIGLLISLGSAAAVFYSLWLFGWICAGFTRD